ncbi:MAG: outer membrane protein with a TonB box [Idiomarina sp. T82-3]|jgi:outer membrane receptor for ferrienterochelin and colicin|uniref:TonB-dependent receptor n=1 Tax=Idiomarina TaxID=135575 RepID=UPI00079BD19C|nr:TonB-dependent receptor [Idiomarina sp. T82-3]KXS36404.1 MAG: outer membrane protein with a TonB box [Idiomarina sp. T82-3]
MKFNSKVSRISAAIALAVGMSTSVMAQETSSSMRGVITGPQGNPVANTKVIVTHEPTGTVNEFVTSADGTFTAKGLRVGGPYTVVIDSDKYQDAELDNLYLALGDTLRVTSQLKNNDMERISVSGSVIMTESGGASSNFGEETIDNMPSLSRDLKDIARINPLVSIRGNGEMSIAGGNPRSNSITVDGIGQNDDFGLNYGGYPTEQPPVSLSSIEQISVDVAPFSSKKGDFSGGTINAVTKSGTNEFEGEFFYEYSSPDMKGDSKRLNRITGSSGNDQGFREYETVDVEPIQKTSTFGMALSGPIIEDTLFFFTNYEEWNSKLDYQYGFQGSGASNEFYTTRENFEEFLSILENTYGVQDSLPGAPEDKDRKWLTKLSWNVNQDHRLDLTYQWQDNSDMRGHSSGGNTVVLNSRIYDYHTRMSNISARLYSDWSANFITEMGITYKDVVSDSITNADFGAVKVEEFFRGPAYEFGANQYRHANKVENQNLTFNFDATYLLGEHELAFGAEYERLRLYNKFVPESLGAWEFDSFDGFQNREVGNYNGTYDFSYQNAYTGNPEDAAYDAVRYTTALYVEDTFYPTPDLELTAGVRYERLSSDDKPTLNQNFVDTYGFTNQENLDGMDIILPRVSFKYYLNDDVTLRGGVGRFYGGVPNVWYSNPFTKDGITLVSANSDFINDYFANSSDPADFTQVPQAIKDSLEQGAGSTNYTDPNFELPNDWRAQLAADYSFDIPMVGNDFRATTSLLYIRKQDEAVWLNTALEPTGTAADGERIIYDTIYSGNRSDNFDIMMTNAEDHGRSYIFTQSLAKQWDNGLNVTMSYTHQDVEEVSPGSSSQAQSNYQHYVAKSRNQPFSARGDYEIEHSFKVTVGYEKEFFDGYKTNINLFYERRSGRPFSYTMSMYQDGDFGDTRDFYTQSAYLAYIPSGADDPNVDWDNSVSWDELSAVLDRAGIAPGGYIMDRNSGTQPWVTNLDLSIKQQIPGFAEGHRGTLYFTIDNLANLLNSDWGVEKRLGYPQVDLYDFGGLSDDGKYQIERLFNGYAPQNYDEYDIGASSWSVKLGVRYEF